MTEWYFAYGSNLSIDQMTARIGRVADGDIPPVRALLPEYRMCFDVPGDGMQVFANVRHPGAGVHGVLYCCTKDALERLDEFEQGYERQRLIVVLENGERREAFVYVADPKGLVSGRSPAADYLQRILTGATWHGLPESHVREIKLLASSDAGYP